MPLLAIFFCGVSYADGGCRCKSFGTLSVGVANTGLGMVARWVDVEANVEVMTMKGSVDKYWFAISCETS